MERSEPVRAECCNRRSDTTAGYVAKLASLAEVIDRARLHVLALQDVGPLDALTPLQATLNWQMRHIALGIPDGRGIRVAFLSTRCCAT